ncbi:DUF2802 domain-containing protein [Shewanella sp. NIFS-20-20]|uniref:DUF2802 domain-containing protein n=1 Tax=Shewanella sp. NIFS-20-20 TaxID=2853806 RepID=UPI001C442FB7|nr:DUF2802 domain-containing protein [Shewanella sp. NIFS-20-20]MBV7314818.1 DUF2802 domain-containing protein [Shewanella sp. NIFS-20-20]
MEDLLQIITLTLSITAIGIAVILCWYVKRLTVRVDALAKVLKASDKQKDDMKRDVSELRSGTIGVGRRVLELENTLSQQAMKLAETQEHDPQARLYSRATKMVSLGADITELMAECELPRAEAELLLRLHRQA